MRPNKRSGLRIIYPMARPRRLEGELRSSTGCGTGSSFVWQWRSSERTRPATTPFKRVSLRRCVTRRLFGRGAVGSLGLAGGRKRCAGYASQSGGAAGECRSCSSRARERTFRGRAGVRFGLRHCFVRMSPIEARHVLDVLRKWDEPEHSRQEREALIGQLRELGLQGRSV